jgi:two-component system, cell cycle response regulator DivK
MLSVQQAPAKMIIAESGGEGGVPPEVPRDPGPILIVEDNELSRKLFQDLLEVHGHRTLATGSGREALRLIQTAAPDLVLLDIQLPDLSGVEVTRRLKSDPRTRHIPIVVVTASLLPDIRRDAWDAGCDGFLEKPIDIDGFLQEIHHHLAERRRPTAVQ